MADKPQKPLSERSFREPPLISIPKMALEEWGGAKAFAQTIADEFRSCKPGSNNRTRLLKLMGDFLHLAHQLQPQLGTPVEHMTEAEIENELHTLLETSYDQPDARQLDDLEPENLCRHERVVQFSQTKDGTRLYRCRKCLKRIERPTPQQMVDPKMTSEMMSAELDAVEEEARRELGLGPPPEISQEPPRTLGEIADEAKMVDLE